MNTKLSAKVGIDLVKGWIKKEVTLAAVEKKIKDFYWSMDHNEFAFTKCPHLSYRIEVGVTDAGGKPVSGITIQGTGQKEAPVTDKDGQAVCYLPNGKYDLWAVNGEQSASKSVTVKGNGKKVSLSLKGESTGSGSTGDIVVSGSCGDHLTYKVTVNGRNAYGNTYTLKIDGYGDMWDFENSKTAANGSTRPWDNYFHRVTKIVLSPDMTSIGNCSFSDLSESVGKIIIPSGVTRIGDWAFLGCIGTGGITIPGSVVRIGTGAFIYSNINGNLRIQEGVKEIGEGAFVEGSFYGDLIIPSSVTAIGISAFRDWGLGENIYFLGNWPAIINSDNIEDASVFEAVSANAYYPAGNSTWTQGSLKDFGNYLRWSAYIIIREKWFLTHQRNLLRIVRGQKTKESLKTNRWMVRISILI